MRNTFRTHLALIASATAPAVHAQAASDAGFAPRFVPAWADAYRDCADGYAQRNAYLPEWASRAPADLSNEADRACLPRLPQSADPSPGAADLALVRGIVVRRLNGGIAAWRAAPTTVLAAAGSAPPAPDARSVHQNAPRPISCPTPEYPPAAIRTMTQGTTVVELAVGKAGQVIGGSVTSASGSTRQHQLLDATALAAMRGCVFETSNGEAPRHASLSYKWALNEEVPASDTSK